MPHASRHLLLTVLVSALGAYTTSTYGQDDTQWQPVDQTVSDLDLRAQSSRRVEQGIGVFGQTGSLYQRPNTGQGWFINGQQVTQQYQLRQPGFTAWIDRPDYLVRDPLGELRLNIAPSQDGRFIDLVPPNTVFDLSPNTPRAFIPYAESYDPARLSPRVDTRIDGWIGTPLGQNPLAVPPIPSPPTANRLPPHLMAQRADRANENIATPQTSDTPASTEDSQNTNAPPPATQPNSEDDTTSDN